MKILLDTNIILSDPTVLSKKKASVSLLIPFPVLLELISISLTRRGGSSISDIVISALKKNIVQIYKLSTISSAETLETLAYRLPKKHIELIAAVQELSKQGEEVSLATQDRVLSQALVAMGIKTIDPKELQDILSEEPEIDEKINHDAKALLSGQTRHFVFGIIVGVLGNVLALLIWTNFERIVSTATLWGTILIIIAVGVVLYALRGRFRLQYGFSEFIFGIVLATKVFWPDFNYPKLNPIDLLQILGGIYVMVRGLDNIGRALKGTRFAFYWDRFSGES